MQFRSPNCSKETAPDLPGPLNSKSRFFAQEPGEGTGSVVFLSGPRLLRGASGCAGAFVVGPEGGAARSFGKASLGGCLRGASGGASRFGGIDSTGILAFGCIGGASRVGGIGSAVILGFGGAFSIGGALG
jgi:hypothetical protein